MTRQPAIYSETADYSNIPAIKSEEEREAAKSAFLDLAEALLWRWIIILFALNVFAAWYCS